MASIHTGVALDVWSSLARIVLAGGGDDSLLIFPGGRLDAPEDAEYLRNSVYPLVNSGNLDALILWSSSIQNAQTKEEFDRFHHSFDPLPTVTLGYKVDGRPCAEFDAYSGMKALVSHCVSAHGARRIAFLRGPAFHDSAQARFQGYLDALASAGLPLDDSLVTTPFAWGAGGAAAAQLFLDRGLAPGRDFDTLIGSSDLMALGALSFFANHGFHVPAHFHAAGFNDSGESKVTECPLSTVRINYQKLCSQAFSLLQRLLSSPATPPPDACLPSTPILRASCGCACTGPMIEAPPAGPGWETWSGDDQRPETGGAAPHTPRRGAEGPPDPPLLDFVGGGLCPPLQNPDKGGSGRAPGPPSGGTGAAPPFHGLLSSLSQVSQPGPIGGAPIIGLVQAQPQDAARAGYERECRHTALNSLKCELLGARDRGGLGGSLGRHLAGIGIDRGAVILFEDENVSRCAASFTPGGLNEAAGQAFPARRLLPEALGGAFGGGVYLVQPLFIENQSLGYFVHNAPFYDGLIFEELRSAVSYALKGMFLLEETVRARRIAEQAEKSKTEFVRALENGIYAPFEGVRERVEAIEKELPAWAGALREKVGELAAFAAREEERAGTLVDMALSRIRDYTPHITVFDPEELLPGIGRLPLLAGDAGLLSQAFSLIRERYGGAITAEPGYAGLELRFPGTEPQPGVGADTDRGLLLAERVILTHGGSFRLGPGECVLRLPWPSLTSAAAPARAAGLGSRILSLSGPEAPAFAAFSGLPVSESPGKAASEPGRIALIVLDAAGDAGDLAKAAGLARFPALAGIPFLCAGPLAGGATLLEGAEKALSRKGAALLAGSRDFWAPIWEPSGDEVYLDAMDGFAGAVAAFTPALILVQGIDPAAAAAIRSHPKTATVPLVMIAPHIDEAAVESLYQYARLLICHSAAAASPEFKRRLDSIRAAAGGGGAGGAGAGAGEAGRILPPYTGGLVKKAILFFSRNSGSYITRWKLAEDVNVSEDYLTRIFHKEMGLSPWDYLNRYRVFLAEERLLTTADSIQQIAASCGFQDQAYFCRLFRKLRGVPPSHIRKGPLPKAPEGS